MATACGAVLSCGAPSKQGSKACISTASHHLLLCMPTGCDSGRLSLSSLPTGRSPCSSYLQG
eukprot:295888-Chlamydomonas_euryale.AAC.2